MDKVENRESFSQLKIIPHEKGDILHGLKASEQSFSGFGEAYFTHINRGEVKGWKKHLEMTMNLIVPVGDVSFHIYDSVNNERRTYRVNRQNYGRLTVPPGLWLAFEGHDSTNLILNIASIEHSPSEAETAPLDKFTF